MRVEGCADDAWIPEALDWGCPWGTSRPTRARLRWGAGEAQRADGTRRTTTDDERNAIFPPPSLFFEGGAFVGARGGADSGSHHE